MLKITALSDITVVVNRRIPQVPDPERSIGPSRGEAQSITLRAGESCDEVVMVYGLMPVSAPAGSEVGIIPGIGEVVAVKQPASKGEVAESFGVIRIEHL